MSRYASVVVEAPVTTVYHYTVPEELAATLRAGQRVRVPLGNRRIGGFCVAVHDACPLNAEQRKRIRFKDVIDAGPPEEAVPEELLTLTRWVASYYRAGWGTALAAAVPSAVRKGTRTPPLTVVSLAAERAAVEAELATLPKNATRQRAVLRWLLANEGRVPAAEIERHTGATRASLRGLEAKGLLRLDAVDAEESGPVYREAEKTIALTAEQEAALARVRPALASAEFAPFLLHGITGSGKTEIYLQALTETLRLGRSALVLVPEISLTPQTVARFRARVGEVAVLHSHLSEGRRAAYWRRLQRGEVRVVVGARSAVFAPLPELGLVVVDEEHEPSFKQDNDPRYHARDVAVMRARECGGVVLLGSATPSLESWRNARTGKYELLRLAARATGSTPTATVVDMRAEWREKKRGGALSEPLRQALRHTLNRGEQAILFLNRRGFHTFGQCVSCGEALRCPHCDISLTLHRRTERLHCHYCDYRIAVPERCPVCASAQIRFSGTGTERVEEEVGELFPEAKLLRMDSDTMTGKDAYVEALSRFAAGEYGILLGTQMVAKGFDFPNVTLVGVLLADSAINLPDFRAAERTFQLITQVVGRAGRAEKRGRALVQVLQPEHDAVQCALAQDYERFAELELKGRKPLAYPPFGRLARVVARGRKEAEVADLMRRVKDILTRAAPRPLMVLGPAPCALARIQEQHRHQVLIKARTPAEIRQMLHALEQAAPRQSGVRLAVDVDPVSLL